MYSKAINAAIQEIRAMGLCCVFRHHLREFRVSFPKAKRDEGYFTDDPDDAVATAKLMIKERDANISSLS